MIEWIHPVLAARQQAQRSLLSRRRRGVLSAAASGLCSIGHAAEEVARFLGIIGVVIPSLALTFVVLGICFHVPRIMATHACRCLLSVCWWHVARGDSGRRPGCSQHCTGACCSLCSLCVRMRGGTFVGSGVVACCTCHRRVVPASGKKIQEKNASLLGGEIKG